MRRKRFGPFVIALTLTILIAYACSRYMPPDSESAVAEQYAAYSSYINSRLTSSSDTVGGGPERKIIICSDPTSLYQKPVWKFFAAAFRGLNGNIGTTYSLFIVNVFGLGRKTRHFDRRFTLLQPYELAASRDLPKLFELADKRRQSIFIFSAVAFNNDLNEALFYTRHHCGSICGEEWFVILRKIKGKWTIAGQGLMGVS